MGILGRVRALGFRVWCGCCPDSFLCLYCRCCYYCCLVLLSLWSAVLAIAGDMLGQQPPHTFSTWWLEQVYRVTGMLWVSWKGGPRFERQLPPIVDRWSSPSLASSRALSDSRGDPRPFPSLPLECGLTNSDAQTAATTLLPSPSLTGRLARVRLLSLSCLTGLGFRVGEGDGRVKVGRLGVENQVKWNPPLFSSFICVSFSLIFLLALFYLLLVVNIIAIIVIILFIMFYFNTT